MKFQITNPKFRIKSKFQMAMTQTNATASAGVSARVSKAKNGMKNLSCRLGYCHCHFSWVCLFSCWHQHYHV